jgi:hypothetical protein
MSTVVDNGSGSKDDVSEEAMLAATRAFGGLVEQIAGGKAFDEQERVALDLSNEIVRRYLEANLQKRADSFGELLTITREDTEFRPRRVHKKHEAGEVGYFSLCGELRVRRSTYRDTTTRNGPTVVPLDLTAGLMERMTPALARSVCLGYGKGPLRGYREDMLAAHRCPPSRSTLERKAKKIGTSIVWQTWWCESLVQEQEPLPPKAHQIVLGLDRTSVPMDPSATGPRDTRSTSTQPTTSGVQWCMDYVGTVSFLDKRGACLSTKRYREPSTARPEKIVGRMLIDVQVARKQKPSVRVSVVQDGADELWRVMRDGLSKINVSWTEVLDYYHASERLSQCTALLEHDHARREALRKSWCTTLLEHPDGARRLVGWLARRARTIKGDARAELDQHIAYYKKRLSQMTYAQHRASNGHIGSGITEGACKSLVAARAKRSGQRWRKKGLDAVLTVRSLVQSDRFDPIWGRTCMLYNHPYVAAA